MMSLSPFALTGAFDFSGPEPSSPDTIHLTSSYTLAGGDSLALSGSPGFKLEVRPHSSIVLSINGSLSVDGGDRSYVAGIATSRSVHGDATVVIGGAGSLTITSNLFGATVAGAVMAVDNSVFSNAGNVQVTAPKGLAAGAVADGATGATLVNNGTMTVDGKIAYGLYMTGGKGLAINAASLDVAGKQAIGLYVLGGDATNDGSLRVAGVGLAVGAAEETGDFINNGEIHVIGKGQVAGVEVVDVSSFQNNGHILAAAQGSLSIGVLFSTASGGVMTNNGLIKGGDFAMLSVDALSGGLFTSNDVLINNGKLDGAVGMGDGSDGISNVGRITGDIDLGGGGDILISNRGHLGGAVMGGLGNDNIEASRAADIIYGDEQDDSLGGGDDVLRGMKGDDQLFGGQGTDTLIGGAGADTLYGGGADDLFKFTKLTDFAPGAADLIADLTIFDIIDLHLIDADTTGGSPGDQAFHRVGAFSNHAGELTVTYDSGTDLTTVAGDVDGDGVADLVINIAGDQSSYSEFVL